jgi:hypothetical protein
MVAEVDKEYIYWLQAHIGLQRDALRGVNKDERLYKYGHIGLLELMLKAARAELRAARKKNTGK